MMKKSDFERVRALAGRSVIGETFAKSWCAGHVISITNHRGLDDLGLISVVKTDLTGG